jgi:hypothetical protein
MIMIEMIKNRFKDKNADNTLFNEWCRKLLEFYFVNELKRMRRSNKYKIQDCFDYEDPKYITSMFNRKDWKKTFSQM